MIPPLSSLDSRPPDTKVPVPIMRATRERLWKEANDTIFAIEETYPNFGDEVRRSFYRARIALAEARNFMRSTDAHEDVAQNEVKSP